MTASGRDHELYKSSFRMLLEDCLGIQPGTEFLVVYDESSLPLLQPLTEVVIEREIMTVLVFLPRQYQLSLIAQTPRTDDSPVPLLPSTLAAAISETQTMLTILSGDLDTVRVRRSILQRPRRKGAKVAHVPGLSRAVLVALGRSPLPEILEASEHVAWRLGEGKSAVLVTHDRKTGEEYRLAMSLGGWANEPLMSPGVIFPDSWGNIPPGETFCCPEPETVNGVACIDGSVPHLVLRRGAQVVLEFQDGKLLRWDRSSSAEARQFFDQQAATAKRNGDTNWNTFAELGIGLNPSIKRLTGNSLFDEKVGGTAHIAIGDNSAFGHDVRAHIHADLVMRHPTLEVDGMDLLRQGRLVVDEAKRDAAIETLSNGVASPDSLIFVNESRVVSRGDFLWRRLSSGGRVGHVRMATEITSRALRTLSETLSTYGSVRALDLIRRHSDIQGISTGKLLGILDHYCVLGRSPVKR